MGNFARIAAIVWLCLGTGAKALDDNPDLKNIELRSVEIVNLRDADLVWLGRDARPSRLLAMVSFSSDIELRNYVRRHKYNIGNTTSVCNETSLDLSKEMRGHPYVYDADGMVDPFRKVDLKNERELPSYLYRFYINLKPTPLAAGVNVDGSPIFHYDLQSDPVDICFRLDGRTMRGNGFISNTVVVPKETLIDALSRAGLR